MSNKLELSWSHILNKCFTLSSRCSLENKINIIQASTKFTTYSSIKL